jgi:hypothetical protein
MMYSYHSICNAVVFFKSKNRKPQNEFAKLTSEESLLKAGTSASASTEAVEAQYSYIHMSTGINAVLNISPHRSWSNTSSAERCCG